GRSSSVPPHRSLSLIRLRPPARPTLFPYTTLFRSAAPSPPTGLQSPPATSRPSPWTALAQATTSTAMAARLLVPTPTPPGKSSRSEEHTSELQSLTNLVCRLLLEKKNTRHHAAQPY